MIFGKQMQIIMLAAVLLLVKCDHEYDDHHGDDHYDDYDHHGDHDDHHDDDHHGDDHYDGDDHHDDDHHDEGDHHYEGTRRFKIDGTIKFPGNPRDYNTLPRRACLHVFVYENILCGEYCEIPQAAHKTIYRRKINVDAKYEMKFRMRSRRLASGQYTISATLNINECQEDGSFTKGDYISMISNSFSLPETQNQITVNPIVLEVGNKDHDNLLTISNTTEAPSNHTISPHSTNSLTSSLPPSISSSSLSFTPRTISTTALESSTTNSKSQPPTITTTSQPSTTTTTSQPPTTTTTSLPSTKITTSQPPTATTTTTHPPPKTTISQPPPKTSTTSQPPTTLATTSKPSTKTETFQSPATTTTSQPPTTATASKPSTLITTSKPSTITETSQSPVVKSRTIPSATTTTTITTTTPNPSITTTTNQKTKTTTPSKQSKFTTEPKSSTMIATSTITSQPSTTTSVSSESLEETTTSKPASTTTKQSTRIISKHATLSKSSTPINDLSISLRMMLPENANNKDSQFDGCVILDIYGKKFFLRDRNKKPELISNMLINKRFLRKVNKHDFVAANVYSLPLLSDEYIFKVEYQTKHCSTLGPSWQENSYRGSVSKTLDEIYLENGKLLVHLHEYGFPKNDKNSAGKQEGEENDEHEDKKKNMITIGLVVSGVVLLLLLILVIKIKYKVCCVGKPVKPFIAKKDPLSFHDIPVNMGSVQENVYVEHPSRLPPAYDDNNVIDDQPPPPYRSRQSSLCSRPPSYREINRKPVFIEKVDYVKYNMNEE